MESVTLEICQCERTETLARRTGAKAKRIENTDETDETECHGFEPPAQAGRDDDQSTIPE